jgi:hypothetical protein
MVKKDLKDEKEALRNYGRYSSLAFQMAFIIVLGTFGGRYLDRWVDWKFPVFTVVLSIFSVFLAIYFAIKDLLNKK